MDSGEHEVCVGEGGAGGEDGAETVDGGGVAGREGGLVDDRFGEDDGEAEVFEREGGELLDGEGEGGVD